MNLTRPMLVAATIAAGASMLTAGLVHADPLKCKAAIAKASSQYVQARTRILSKCRDAIVAGKLPLVTDCGSDSKVSDSLDKAKKKLEGSIEKACGGPDKDCGNGDDDSLLSIGWTTGTCPDLEHAGCGSIAITDCDRISDCLECVDGEAVDQVVELYYDALSLPSAANKPLNKCQKAIGKATGKFLAAKSKALEKCWGAVNKNTFPGPCPFPGDGKAQSAIESAEAKKIAAICKACGGADKGCDQAVSGPNGTNVPGTGGSDDLTPAAIGFPATCDDLTIPGGASCAQPIATLADLVECVDCITEFKVDCVDPLAVPWAKQYPPQCNPGCGNNVIEPGEVCDGTDDLACPGQCAPANIPDGCTCPTGTFALAGTAGAELDTGWTGIAHDQGALVGRLFSADTYGCSSAGADKLCSFVARYANPFFGAPLPLSSGGVPVCVVNEVLGQADGTLDLVTGDFDYNYKLTSRVHLGIDIAQPCPTCVGDAVVDDDVKDGTCNGGPSNGSPCDVDGVSASFGGTSFDCPPSPGNNVGNLRIVFDDATTGTKVVATSAASPNCRAAGFTTPQCVGGTNVGVGCTAASECPGGICEIPKCFCDTCNNANADACATNADCPTSGGNPGICGGKRCVGGTNNGAPCSAASECPGAGFCQVPGTATAPHSCNPPDGDPDGCQPSGGNEGECANGPLDQNCAAPEQFRACTIPTQVADCPLTGVCVPKVRECLLDPLTRTGTAGLPNGAYAGTFCIAPTGSTSVNGTAGLPGLGALILPYTLTISVP